MLFRIRESFHVDKRLNSSSVFFLAAATFGMRSRDALSFNLVNMYTKFVNVVKTFTRNMAISNKTQMVLSSDSSIIVSNGQQLPVTKARQPLMKFVIA